MVGIGGTVAQLPKPVKPISRVLVRNPLIQTMDTMKRTDSFWNGVKRTLIALSEGTARPLTLIGTVEQVPEGEGWSFQELVNHFRQVSTSPIAQEEEILQVASLMGMIRGDRIHRVSETPPKPESPLRGPP